MMTIIVFYAPLCIQPFMDLFVLFSTYIIELQLQFRVASESAVKSIDRLKVENDEWT